MKKGEILLSYLGKQVDDDEGNLLVPDHPNVYESLLQHLTYKWYSRQFKTTRDQTDRLIYLEAKNERDTYIARANATLQMPSADRLQKYWTNSKFNKMHSAYKNILEGTGSRVTIPHNAGPGKT